MNKIERAIIQLSSALKEEYGIDSAIVKIDVKHEVFDALVIDSYKKQNMSSVFRPSQANEFRLVGVRIDARSK